MTIYNPQITNINRKHGVNGEVPYNSTLYKKKVDDSNEVLFPLFHYDSVESNNTIYAQDKYHIVISDDNSLIFHSNNEGVVLFGVKLYAYHYADTSAYNVILHDRYGKYYAHADIDVYVSSDGTNYNKVTSVKTNENGLATYINDDGEYVKFKYNGVWSNEL